MIHIKNSANNTEIEHCDTKFAKSGWITSADLKNDGVIFRCKLDELFASDDYFMVVNSININNGSCGVYKNGADNKFLNPQSHMFTILSDGKTHYLFAFLPPIFRRTRLYISDGAIICDTSNRGNKNLYPTERLFISKDDNINSLLNELKHLYRTVQIDKIDITSFNSWDYFLSGVTMKDIQDSMAAIKDSGLKVDAVVIDDGWQISGGEWRANEKFGDMGDVAKEISGNGFIPGIWLAPFYVDEKAADYNNYPLAKTCDGDTYKQGPFALLDITEPMAMQKIINDITTLYEYGFKIFKLDFLHYLVSDDAVVLTDEEFPRIELIRSFLSKVKNIGENIIVVSCGCPIEAAAYTADINRIGGDIAPFINTVKILTEFLSVRWWTNGILYTSDPDFLVVRSAVTSMEDDINPHMVKCMGEVFWDEVGSRTGESFATLGEVRMWAALVAASGGIVSLADNISELNRDGLDIIEKVMKYKNTESACPIDLFTGKLCEMWYSEKDNSICLINFESITKTYTFDLDKYAFLSDELIDVFGNCLKEKQGNQLKITLKAHDGALIIKEMA